MLTRRRKILGFLALALIAEIAVVIAFVGGGGDEPPLTALPLHPVAQSFTPDGTQLDECSDQS